MLIKKIIEDNIGFSKFPMTDSPDFTKRATLNWQNLLKKRLTGSDCGAAWLYIALNPIKGRVKNKTIFYIWLVLCELQPWENEWTVKLSTSRDNLVLAKLDDLYTEATGEEPGYIQVRTLKKHLQKKSFWAWEPIKMISAAFEAHFKNIAKPIPGLAKSLSKFAEIPKLFDSPHFKMVFKFAIILRTEKYIKKRDLQRKLRIKKDYLESLLKWAESSDDISRISLPHKSEWIILKR